MNEQGSGKQTFLRLLWVALTSGQSGLPYPSGIRKKDIRYILKIYLLLGIIAAIVLGTMIYFEFRSEAGISNRFLLLIILGLVVLILIASIFRRLGIEGKKLIQQPGLQQNQPPQTPSQPTNRREL